MYYGITIRAMVRWARMAQQSHQTILTLFHVGRCRYTFHIALNTRRAPWRSFHAFRLNFHQNMRHQPLIINLHFRLGQYAIATWSRSLIRTDGVFGYSMRWADGRMGGENGGKHVCIVCMWSSTPINCLFGTRIHIYLNGRGNAPPPHHRAIMPSDKITTNKKKVSDEVMGVAVAVPPALIHYSHICFIVNRFHMANGISIYLVLLVW